jgi:hypothetical protein
MQTDRALSETVSLILIIAMILILALVVVALVFGNLTFQQKSALVSTDLGNQTLTISGQKVNVMTVFHRAGDEFSINSSFPGQHEMAIYIDNRTNSTRAQPVLGLNIIKPGTTLYIYYNASKKVYRVSDTPNLKSGEAQSVTDCPLRVRLVDETAKLLITSYNWTCVPRPLTGPAPTVTGRTNATVYRGWTAYELITGTNFLVGATSTLNRTSYKIPSSTCVVRSSTQMFCSYPMAGVQISPPTFNVSVTNPDGKTAVMTPAGANPVTVSTLVPTLSSRLPTSGSQGQTITAFNIRGNNFQPGAMVKVWRGTYVLLQNTATVNNATGLVISLPISLTAPAGNYNVTVSNTDNGNVTGANWFAVVSNAPTVTSITNRTGYRGWNVIENISGTNFVSGATARFNRTGYADIPATSCTYISSTRLYCIFSMAGLAASPTNAYNVVVTNPPGAGGKEAMLPAYFTVASPPPTFTSTTPTNLIRGTPASITVAGNYFQPTTSIRYWRGSTASYTLASADVRQNRITGSLDIPAGAPAGLYNITILNPDGLMVIRNNSFTVYATGPPTISSINPVSGKRGVLITPVIVTGGNFQAGARVALYNGTTGLYTAPLGTVTATQITTTFTVPATTIPNQSHVRVTNPDGQYATLPFAYKITLV